MAFWESFEAARACRDHLARKGLSVEILQDASSIKSAVSDIGKSYLTPWLDPDQNDFTAANHFWLVAKNSDGPQILGGARIDQYGECASEVIHRMFARAYGDKAVRRVSPELDSQLTGRVAYFGDLWSKAGCSLGRQNLLAYTGIANYIASVHFQVDAIYSFMRMRDIRRGSADTSGFIGRVLQPLEWGDVPEARDMSEQIVYRKSQDNFGYFSSIRRELEYT